MDFVGLSAFIQHVTRMTMTTVRRNSITVDLDDSEAIVAHMCAMCKFTGTSKTYNLYNWISSIFLLLMIFLH